MKIQTTREVYEPVIKIELHLDSDKLKIVFCESCQVCRTAYEPCGKRGCTAKVHECKYLADLVELIGEKHTKKALLALKENINVALNMNDPVIRTPSLTRR